MGLRGILRLKLFTITELLDNIIMKMLSDLLIGHNWPIIGRFLSNYSKNQLVDPNVLYSFDGYQKNSIDSNISGKKS